MYEKKFKELLEEMRKYRADDSNLKIQEWELISVCNEIALVVAEMRNQENQNDRYEMTDEELEDVQWVYAYLRTRTNSKG